MFHPSHDRSLHEPPLLDHIYHNLAIYNFIIPLINVYHMIVESPPHMPT